ncbi:MAG: dihydrofolate reductase [Thermomicrobiales bacterium]|nr:dihydrofolate reductase [Thermomicrobiales bacterium]
MRSRVATLWVSLDGVAEAPEMWAFAYSDADLMELNGAQMAASDAMLLGRVTYQHFAAFWPCQPAGDRIADYINPTPRYVVSSTLQSVDWQNSTLLGGNLDGEIARLKSEPGEAITVVGSPTLARSLLGKGLLDELRLTIAPVVVGGARPFADAGTQQALRLADSRVFSSGAVYLAYRPAAN